MFFPVARQESWYDIRIFYEMIELFFHCPHHFTMEGAIANNQVRCVRRLHNEVQCKSGSIKKIDAQFNQDFCIKKGKTLIPKCSKGFKLQSIFGPDFCLKLEVKKPL